MTSKAPAQSVPTIGLGTLLQPSTLRLIARRLNERLWSTREAIGILRDLDMPFTPPEAKLPLEIVELGPDELPGMVDADLAKASALDILGCASRRALWQRQFGRCFVAKAPDGQACFLQWLFDHRDTAAIAAHFCDAFPTLAEGETLLEGAYTPAAFRGQRIMPAAMARIAEHAADTGAQYVHIFFGIDNMPSLKGCVRASIRISGAPSSCGCSNAILLSQQCRQLSLAITQPSTAESLVRSSFRRSQVHRRNRL